MEVERVFAAHPAGREPGSLDQWHPSHRSPQAGVEPPRGRCDESAARIGLVRSGEESQVVSKRPAETCRTACPLSAVPREGRPITRFGCIPSCRASTKCVRAEASQSAASYPSRTNWGNTCRSKDVSSSPACMSSWPAARSPAFSRAFGLAGSRPDLPQRPWDAAGPRQLLPPLSRLCRLAGRGTGIRTSGVIQAPR
jgi:hypothetical protein